MVKKDFPKGIERKREKREFKVKNQSSPRCLSMISTRFTTPCSFDEVLKNLGTLNTMANPTKLDLKSV